MNVHRLPSWSGQRRSSSVASDQQQPGPRVVAKLHPRDVPLPFAYMTNNPSLRMSTRYDRPEGYGLLTHAQRVSVGGALLRRDIVSGGKSEQPRSQSAQAIRPQSAAPAASGSASAAQDSGAPALMIRSVSVLGGLRAALEDNDEAHYSSFVASAEPRRANSALSSRLRGQVMEANSSNVELPDSSHAIEPGRGREAVIVPLSACNLKLLRPEPCDPETGDSLLTEARAAKVEAWVRSQAGARPLQPPHHADGGVPSDETFHLTSLTTAVNVTTTHSLIKGDGMAAVEQQRLSAAQSHLRHQITSGLKRASDADLAVGKEHLATRSGHSKSGGGVVVVDPTRLDEEGQALRRKQTLGVVAAVRPPFGDDDEDDATESGAASDMRSTATTTSKFAAKSNMMASEDEEDDASVASSIVDDEGNGSIRSDDGALAGNGVAVLRQRLRSPSSPKLAASRGGIALMQQHVYEASDRQRHMLHLQLSVADLQALQQQAMVDAHLSADENISLAQPSNYTAGPAAAAARRGRGSRAGSRSVSIVPGEVATNSSDPPSLRGADGDGSLSFTAGHASAARRPTIFLPTTAPLPNPAGAAGAKAPGRCWNDEFQSTLDEVWRRTSAEAMIDAYDRLRELHSSFHAACRAFVEEHLVPVIVPQVSVTHGNITFTLQSLHVPGAEEDAASESVLLGDSVNGGSSLDLSETLRRRRSRRRSTLAGYMSDERRASTRLTSLAQRGSVGSDNADDEDDDETRTALDDALLTELECQRRLASNEMVALNCIAQHWWECSGTPQTQQAAASQSLHGAHGAKSISANVSPSLSPRIPQSLVADFAATTRSSVAANAAVKRNPAAAAGYVPLQKRKVVFPLACVVHFMGHVVTCTASLPPDATIIDDSLIEDDPAVRDFLAVLGSKLGMAPYVTALDDPFNPNPAVIVTLSRSVGVARSRSDGRCYIVAAPAILAPMLPTIGYSRWLRMRPEFSANFCDGGLCADAFSPSQVFPDKITEHVKIVRATRRIVHKNLADVFARILQATEPLTGAELCTVLHQCGVNLSFLGKLADTLSARLRCFDTHAEPSPQKDMLEKYFAVVKEEMCVRAFRQHFNKLMRTRALRSTGAATSVVLPDALQVATTLVRCFFGAADDSGMHSLWVKHIAPAVRSKFKYRGIIRRRDVCIRTASARIEQLCGLKIADFDLALDSQAAIDRSDGLLKLELRSHRACLVGVVNRIGAYVKGMLLPHLPPLTGLASAHISDTVPARFVNLCDAAAESEGKRSELLVVTMLRRAEALQLAGDHNFSASERVLLRVLHRQMQHTVPLCAGAVRTHQLLAKLYHVEHRYAEAIAHLNEALCLEVAVHGEVSAGLIPILQLLASNGKDGSKRDVAVTALERCLWVLTQLRRREEATAVRKLLAHHAQRHDESVASLRDRLSQPASKAVSGCPSPAESNLSAQSGARLPLSPLQLNAFFVAQLGSTQSLLDAAMDELSVIYGMVAVDRYPPFAGPTASRAMLRALFETGVRQLRRFNALGSHCVFQRASQLAKHLHSHESVKASERVGPEVVQRCEVNAAVVSSAMSSA